MRTHSFSFAALALLIVAETNAAEKLGSEGKENKENIVGTWDLEALDGKKLPEPIKFEFSAGGKLKMHLPGAALESSYKWEGDGLTVTRQAGDATVTDHLGVKWDTPDRLLIVDKGKQMRLVRRAPRPAVKLDPIDPKNLAGTWEIVGKPGITVQFAVGGKITIAAGMSAFLEGTYQLDGANGLAVHLSGPEMKQVSDLLTIRTLTDEKLVTIDSKEKEETLKRVK